jgi:outer membrane immunogenic protein
LPTELLLPSIVCELSDATATGSWNKEKNMKSIAAIFTAAIVAGPALAGGPVAVEPEPVIAAPAPVLVTSPDWGGFYAGGQLGYGDVDSNGAGLDGNGWLGGIHGGYRWDFGQFVFGTELDYDAADISLGGGAGSLDDVTRAKLVGGADLGSSLLYATTGYAYATAEAGTQSLSDDGWFYGGGLTFAVNDQWTIGGEILQHDFGNFDGSGIDFDALTATARVGFRF